MRSLFRNRPNSLNHLPQASSALRLLPLMFLLLLAFPGTPSLSAEPLRGPYAGTIELRTGQEEFSEAVAFTLEDLVFITVPQESPFVDGLELEIQVPREARNYREALSLNLYQDISPQPGAKQKNYTARNAHMAFLPETSRFYIRIPVVYDHSLTASGDTEVLNEPILPTHFPLALTLLPLMKGIPDAAFSVELLVRARPLLRDEGKLELTVDHGSIAADDFSIFLDGKPQDQREGAFLLPTGIHEILVEAPGGHRQAEEFVILQGQTNHLTITLEESLPRLSIEIPQDAEVLLDGSPPNAESGVPFEISPGKHTILFRLGEYKLTKEFTLQRGDKAQISLNMEILLEK